MDAQDSPAEADESVIQSRLEEAGFLRALTDAQRRDVAKLGCLAHGANYSVPGAGKTTSLLAVHSLQVAAKPDLALLIVAPKNAVISWEDELLECLGSRQRLVRLTGGSDQVAQLLLRNPRFSIITYDQLRRCVADLGAFMWRKPVHLVLDEAHRIKGGAEKATASAVLGLAPLAFRRDILTGTPMPQCLDDLVPQFDFLWVGQDIVRAKLDGAEDEPEQIEAVTGAVRPLYVRTTKKELNLPDVKHTYVSVEMPPAQREIYDLIVAEAARQARGLGGHSAQFFRSLKRHVVRLLQAASNPALIVGGDGSSEDAEMLLASVDPAEFRSLLMEYVSHERPAKLNVAETLARRLVLEESRKVVLWSFFVNNIHYLANQLADLGAVELYGATPSDESGSPETREGRIRMFHHDPDCRVMVANPQACGEGISLHRVCQDAIYVDRSFNAAHYLQSVDRIHRLGLKPDQTVNVIILEAEDSIDTVVRSRLDRKIERMGRVLEDPGLLALTYDPEDVLDRSIDGLEPGDLKDVVDYILGCADAG